MFPKTISACALNLIERNTPISQMIPNPVTQSSWPFIESVEVHVECVQNPLSFIDTNNYTTDSIFGL